MIFECIPGGDVMSLVEPSREGSIALLTMNRGVINAIDPEQVRELRYHLQEVKKNPEIIGMVLQSANDKFFSIGLDIPLLFEYGEEELLAFILTFDELCMELYALPKPTVAAITGHATAGGCILAICCDRRVMASGRKFMGVNEITLGVPLPYPADCILTHEFGTKTAQLLQETGELFLPETLHHLNVIDEVVSPEEVRQRAIERAKNLGELPAQAFQVIKANRVEAVRARVNKDLAEREKDFVRCWRSGEARPLLKEAMEKFKPPAP
jgi:enoyl-CoA hydratase/carnithine racemase